MSFTDRLRSIFGLDIREDTALETFCKKNYTLVPNIAYEQKRNIKGVSYDSYINEFITPKAFAIEKFKKRILLKDDVYQQVRNVGNTIALKLKWTSDKDLENSEDYYQYPNETLALQKGDCEDHAFLLTSCLPEIAGLAYGLHNNGGHAWNCFVMNDELWIIDTVADTSTIEKYKEGSYRIHYIITPNYTFLVNKGLHFGDIAKWE